MMPDLSSSPAWLPVVLGLAVVVQLGLQVWALVDLSRTPADRLQFGRKWPWVVIVLGVNTIGAVVYLAAAKRPAPVEDAEGPADPARARGAVDALYGTGTEPER